MINKEELYKLEEANILTREEYDSLLGKQNFFMDSRMN